VARRKTGSPPSPPPRKPNLVSPRDEVEGKLKERITLGVEIQLTELRSEAYLDNARNKQNKWNSYNIEYLKRCFDSEVIAEEYNGVSGWGSLFMNPSLGQQIQCFKEGIGNQITELESILERLELIPEVGIAKVETTTPISKSNSNSVFIVHGHDETAKTNVARFVEKLGLEAIILHEQPNKGQTIIEKFESNAANVGFAVVLLTPDDVGAPKNSQKDVNARARQNVILELGYFCGALGRNNVCVLYKEEIEIPSDYLGVVYTPLDSAEGWHLKLAKEMKEAGLEIDLNKAM
jgi:predicted nucleotide-binding protein